MVDSTVALMYNTLVNATKSWSIILLYKSPTCTTTSHSPTFSSQSSSHQGILLLQNHLITVKAFLANRIMTNKHNSPDQLAKPAGVSESSGIQPSKGDAPALVNLPKRRMSEGQNQNKQALIEKKPKLADKDNQK